MEKLVIIDYGMGNLHSIAKAVEQAAADHQAGVSVQVSADPGQVLAADRVIFPGVGAIRDCMDELRQRGLHQVIAEVAASRPLLGVCLGLQALLSHSDENGGIECLGLIPGRAQRFPGGLGRDGERLKIPHMGWNQVHQVDHPMWAGIDQDSRFYFVHSYYATPDQPGDCAGHCEHGIEFCAALAQGPLFAVQFHPEKSQHAGLQLLANFLTWDGRA